MHTTPTANDETAQGRILFQGIPIVVENWAGSTRSGQGDDGKTWTRRMMHHYGYIAGRQGADGDSLDVFVGPDTKSHFVLVVNQVDKNGDFDEHKVLLGFPNPATAKLAYLSNYPPGWVIGPTKSTTIDALKAWVEHGNQNIAWNALQRCTSNAAWKEDDHPRAADGKFSGPGDKPPKDRDPTISAHGQHDFPEGWHRSPAVRRGKKVRVGLQRGPLDESLPPVAFDLDKTLWDEDPELGDEQDKGVRYNDPDRIRRLQPIEAAISKAKALAHPLLFITGRTDNVRHLIEAKLAELGLEGRLITQPKWDGYDAMTEYKAKNLEESGAALMVGDHAQDYFSAERSGAPFLHAEDWAQNHSLQFDAVWGGVARADRNP